MRKLVIVSVMAFSCLFIASAKSYDVTFTSPTKAGTVQLKAGQYRMKVDGSIATFIEVNSGKSFTTVIKVQTGDKKFDQTRVGSTKVNGADTVKQIELGGSNTLIEFAE
jgi:hypothetical protein